MDDWERYAEMKNTVSQMFTSNGLDKENLKSMTFMCNFLTPRRREKIRSFLDLCQALEENLKLSAKDVTYLVYLLKQCCRDRKDILSVVEHYSHRQSGPAVYIPQKRNVNEITHNYVQTASLTDTTSMAPVHLSGAFDKVSSELGIGWRPVARALKLTEGDIDQITLKHERDLRGQIYEALTTWAQKNQHQVGKNELADALRRCDKNSLAREIEAM